MVEPATQLMLAVKTPAAGAALLAALDEAKGRGRVTIVKALGELGVAAANPRVLKLADDPDPGRAPGGVRRARPHREPGVPGRR